MSYGIGCRRTGIQDLSAPYPADSWELVKFDAVILANVGMMSWGMKREILDNYVRSMGRAAGYRR